nr:immunoglobulin light chain junction region [Macaca mulatta]
YYHYYSGRAF